MNDDLLTPALTVSGTIVSIFITNKLTLSRTRREKAWELRREAYSKMMYELEMAELVCTAIDKAIDEEGENYFQRRQFLIPKLHEHVFKASRAYRANRLIISEYMAELFNRLSDEQRETRPDEDPPETYYRFSGPIKRFVP